MIKNKNRFFLHYNDLLDSLNHNLIKKINPDEIYNLAAQSHVAINSNYLNTSNVDAQEL